MRVNNIKKYLKFFVIIDVLEFTILPRVAAILAAHKKRQRNESMAFFLF